MSDLKIFAKTIEPQAKAQIDLLLAQEPFKDCKVRIMPDVHAGAGCVIGFTANLGNKVIPNIVGVDIGCGMLTVYLGKVKIDYPALDRVIRDYVPSGMDVHEGFEFRIPYIDDLVCRERLRNIERLHASLGTLGGGNHFIEIDEDGEDKYLVIHTGSRNLGKQVAEIYQDLAVRSLQSQKATRDEIISRYKAEGREREIASALAALKGNCAIPRDLCYVEGKNRDDYLNDMKICQRFAADNRRRIARVICEHMGWTQIYSFHTVHNYIDGDNMVRKGAISAKKYQSVLIPINMKDGCILGGGRGNEDWNYSAPHGAGRLMSRAKAKASIPLEEYQAAMSDVFTTSVSLATLDEAPQAYKPMDEILDCIADTVNVWKILKPAYNFKAGEEK